MLTIASHMHSFVSTIASTIGSTIASRLAPRVRADARAHDATRASRAVSLLFIAALSTTALSACSSNSDPVPTNPSIPAQQTFAASLGVNIAAMTKKSDDLYIQDLVVGTGSEAIAGRTLRMNYTGWLIDARQFDSSVGRSPFEFTLGRGQVITGWDLGIAGMRVGGKRKLVIGSNLGYGPSGQGAIGPNATLVFDVELISVQ